MFIKEPVRKRPLRRVGSLCAHQIKCIFTRSVVRLNKSRTPTTKKQQTLHFTVLTDCSIYIVARIVLHIVAVQLTARAISTNHRIISTRTQTQRIHQTDWKSTTFIFTTSIVLRMFYTRRWTRVYIYYYTYTFCVIYFTLRPRNAQCARARMQASRAASYHVWYIGARTCVPIEVRTCVPMYLCVHARFVVLIIVIIVRVMCAKRQI